MTEFEKFHQKCKSFIGYSKTDKVSKEYEIGITNDYDPSRDLSVFNRLCNFYNVIITRDLSNPLFVNELLKHKVNTILHAVCTGFGNTPVEPFTPHPLHFKNSIISLINAGFPASQIVLRIDPVIPNEQGLKALEAVLECFAQIGIKRCRYKLFKMNDNILYRHNFHILSMYGFTNPYYREIENKVYPCASQFHRKQVYDILKKYEIYYDFESCDRDDLFETVHQLGCISYKDFWSFGVRDVDMMPNLKRKNHCICPVNKVELFRDKKQQCNLLCTLCKHKTVY